MLLILIGDSNTEEILEICKEEKIPYALITSRNYKCRDGRYRRRLEKHKPKLLQFIKAAHTLRYCAAFSDITVNVDGIKMLENTRNTIKAVATKYAENVDAEELADIIGTEDYVFMLIKDVRTFRNAITIVKRNGDLSSMQAFKAESNPIYFHVQRVY